MIGSGGRADCWATGSAGSVPMMPTPCSQPKKTFSVVMRRARVFALQGALRSLCIHAR